MDRSWFCANHEEDEAERVAGRRRRAQRAPIKHLEDLDHDENSLRSLEQIAEAHSRWGIHAGVVLTTATEASDAFEDRRESLSDELGIDIQVLFREQFVDLVLEHVAAEAGASPSQNGTAP